MSAQKGIELVLKVEQDGSPSAFTSVLSCQTNTLKFNEEPVDVTAKDAVNRWMEQIRAGIRSMEWSGEGIFKDSAAFELLRANMMDANDTIKYFQMVVPDFGTFQGPFIITGMEMGGAYNEAVTHSFELASAGPVTFTAA